MTLRSRIEAKPRRRVSVPVQVSDPGQDLQRAAEATTYLLAAQADPTRASELPALQDARDGALAAVNAHVETVWFQALSPDDLEALVDEHSKGDDIDRDALRAALAAECAEDEDLRDRAWWAEQLSPKGRWTSGERDQLYHVLLTELHYSVPAAALPKG